MVKGKASLYERGCFPPTSEGKTRREEGEKMATPIIADDEDEGKKKGGGGSCFIPAQLADGGGKTPFMKTS